MFKKLLFVTCAFSCQVLLPVKIQAGYFEQSPTNSVRQFVPTGHIIELTPYQTHMFERFININRNGFADANYKNENGNPILSIDVAPQTLELLLKIIGQDHFDASTAQTILHNKSVTDFLQLFRACEWFMIDNVALRDFLAQHYLAIQEQISLDNFATYAQYITTFFSHTPTAQTLLSNAVAPYACLQTLAGNGHWIRSVAFSPDGQTLASGSFDITIKLWRLHNGQYEYFQTLTGHNNSIFSVAFSPDGQTLASGSDSTIKLWQLHNGQYECLQTLIGHNDSINSIAFSPDGQTLASGSWDNTIKLWRLHNGQYKCFQTLIGHNDSINSIAFSPNGQTLASGSRDTTIKLWRLHNDQYECFQTLTGHNDSIYSVAFSPDGQTLVSGSSDRTIKLWRLHNGHYECFQTLMGHNDSIYSVAFSPDGQTLASGSWDKTIKLWTMLNCQQQMLFLWAMNNPREFVHGNEFLDGIFTSLPIQLQNKIITPPSSADSLQ